jgi:hypothetical protein
MRRCGLYRRRATVVQVVVLLVGAACSGGASRRAVPAAAAGPTSTTVPPVTTTTTLPPVAPLTGLPLTDQATLARPALTIKIENPPYARPQSGLDAADVVFEEIVEGGITRFVAVFQSTDAPLVGPVRSVRPSDPDIISPFGGLFGYSGGTPKFIDLLRATPGITDVGVDLLQEGDGKAYVRVPGRTAPDNLYTSTPSLYAAGPPMATPPPRFADFVPAGQQFSAGGATPAFHVTAQVGDTTAVFDYDAASNTYQRAGLVDGPGVVAPANVIVQFTAYEPSPGDEDVNGTPVEKADTISTGDALIVAGGMAVKGTWTKSSQSAYTSYTDANGAPIKLLPGRTWIELARNGAPAAAT